MLAPTPKPDAPSHSACHAGSKDGSHFVLRRDYLISGKFLISAITDKEIVREVYDFQGLLIWL